jgi:hypothetical protein
MGVRLLAIICFPFGRECTNRGRGVVAAGSGFHGQAGDYQNLRRQALSYAAAFAIPWSEGSSGSDAPERALTPPADKVAAKKGPEKPAKKAAKKGANKPVKRASKKAARKTAMKAVPARTRQQLKECL